VIAEFPDVPRAVVVPQRAVLDEQGGSYVLLVGSGDKVERRSIRPGRMVDGRQEILEGLVGGERVVVDGVQGVRPGDVVRVESGAGEPARAKEAVAEQAGKEKRSAESSAAR
jgi:multidrug efflux pump subunit AcrA (membrane-fusion protein)